MRKGFYTGTVFVIVTIAMAFSEGTTVDDHNRGSTKKIEPSGTIEVSETRTRTVNISPSSTLIVNGDSRTNIKPSKNLPTPTSVVKSESRTKIGKSNISPLSTSVVNGKSGTTTQTSNISPTSSSVVNGKSGTTTQTSNILSSKLGVNGISGTMTHTSNLSPSSTLGFNGISEKMIQTLKISTSFTSIVNEKSGTMTHTSNILPSSTSVVNGITGKMTQRSDNSPTSSSVVNGISGTMTQTPVISPTSSSVVNGISRAMTQTSDISPTSSSVFNGISGTMTQTSDISPTSSSDVNGISGTMTQSSDISPSFSSVVNGIPGTMTQTSDISPTSSSVVYGNSGTRNETDSKNSNGSPKPKYKTHPPNLDGKVINISSAVHLTTKKFPVELYNKSSSTYNHYRRVFHNALSKKFQSLRGFIGIVISGFRKGSIIIDYSIKLDAVVIVSETNEELNKSLSNINQNWTEFKKDMRNGNITKKLDEDKTKNGIQRFLKNELKTFTNKCNVPGVCGFGFSCVKESCQQICNDDYCNRHGKCVLDYEKEKATCACDAFHTGEKCTDKNSEVFPSKERLLIIEIAGGAGGGVIMFLFIVLVCVCVQWRKSAGKEKMSDEKKTLKENETFDLRELGGKSNPIYDKDVANDVAESIPSRRDSFERKLPIFTPSDEKMGHRMESFGKPLEYDRRNTERNFIRREDGRFYHVIDDGGPSNQTLIYQPSVYQHSNGSVVETHAQSPYTDFPRRQNVYDSIDTTREYKITRPNIGRRSQNYDY